MSLSSSRPMLRQSLPPVHSRPDFRARCPHCLPGCRSGRTPLQFPPRREKSVPSRACPSEAAELFSPSFVSLRLIPSPPLHRANLAPRPRLHAPRLAKLPAPNLAPPPLPGPLAPSTQTADTPLPFLHRKVVPLALLDHRCRQSKPLSCLLALYEP